MNSSNEENSIIEFTEIFQLSKFEIKPVASLPSFKLLNEVSIHCVVSNFLVITLDKKLSVFKEESQELFWELEFDSEIDSLVLSDHLGLILAVENNILHFLHISSQLKWSTAFENDGSKCTVEKAFICDTSDLSSIYIYTKENILFIMSEIDSSSLSKALEDGRVSEFYDGIPVEKINFESMYPDLQIKSMFETFCPDSPLGLVTTNKVNVLKTDCYDIDDVANGNLMFDEELNTAKGDFNLFDFSGYGEIKKIMSTRDSRYIVCLDEQHMLSAFSSITQMKLATLGEDIQDFVLYENLDPNTSSVSDRKIGLLRKCDSYLYEIRKFPSFEYLYKIPLSEFSQLVESKPNQDAWYILEGHKPVGNEESSMVKITSISDSQPETRLSKLLTRKKFKEAVKYAKMHSLDEEIIHKTKIDCMFKDYTNEAANLSKQELDAAWEIVEKHFLKIKDVGYLKSWIDFIPEINVLKRYLSFIHHWVAVNSIAGAEDLICLVNKHLNKLETYMLLPESICSNLPIEDFLKKNLLEYMKSELVSQDLATAALLWKRHKMEFLVSLTPEEVGEILKVIPNDISSSCLISFLKEDFLPPLLTDDQLRSQHLDTVEIIAEWIIHRIHLMENFDKETWPHNGKELALMFFEMIQILQEKHINNSTSLSLASTHERKISSDSQICCLYELSKTLKLLVLIKENFDCKISLAVHKDNMEVLFAVLDKIKLKFISEFITKLARPYALENELNLNSCLESYIKETVKAKHFTWWSWYETIWEERLILVLECIKDSSIWANAALYLIEHALVPWSDKLKSIVKQGSTSKHPSEEVFKKLSKEVLLKEVLVKYECKNFQMNRFHSLETCREWKHSIKIYEERKLYEHYLKIFNKLINYIIKEDRITALEDAKMVVLSHTDVLDIPYYKNFLQAYIHQNKFDKLTALHSTIPRKIAIECAKSLLTYVTLYLDDSFLVENDKDHINVLIYAGVYFIDFLKSEKQPVDTELQNALTSVKKLMKEFDITATLSDVRESASKIIETFIYSTLEEMEAYLNSQQAEKVAVSINKIKRLGYILHWDEGRIISVLIKSCFERKKYDLVVKLCRDLLSSSPSEKNADNLLEIVNYFLQNFQNIEDIPFKTIISTVCHLCSIASTHCDIDNIEKCLRAVRLSTYLAVLSEIPNQDLFLFKKYADKYHKWRFSPVYEDKGFPLDSSKVFYFITKLVPLFYQNGDILGQEEMFAIFKPIICEMKDKSQLIIAIQTMCMFYHLQMENTKQSLMITEPSEKVLTASEVSKSNSSVGTIMNEDSLVTADEPCIQQTNRNLPNTIEIEDYMLEAYKLIDKDLLSITFTIMNRIIDRKNIDLDLCIGLLSMFPLERSKILEKLRKLPSNTLRHMRSLGEIGSECFRIWDELPTSAEYDKIYERAQFLMQNNVRTPDSSMDLSSTNCDYNWDIVKGIILSPKTPISAIFNCCTAFELSSYDILIAYLNNLLTEADRICLQDDESAEKDLNLILNQAKYAIAAIVNEELIVNFLKNILSKISVYSHEVLLFIYEQLLQASANVLTFIAGEFESIMTLLKFLQVYQRISPPVEIECEHWQSLHPVDVLPAIAKKRLPFLALPVYKNSIWKIINPELTASTLETWLKVAPVVQISTDDCTLIAVRNYFTSHFLKLDTKDWMDKDLAFMQIIQKMMSNISNFQNLVGCASWVANRMPPGGNKVCFSQYAVKSAASWIEQHPSNKDLLGILGKLTDLHQRSAIEEILYQENLANSASLMHVRDPVHLIEYFMEEYFLSIDSSIKACKAAVRISKIIPFDLEEIFCKYIFKWLTVIQNDMDSFTETLDLKNLNDCSASEGINEKNIVRIINLILGMKNIGNNICEVMLKNKDKMTFTQRCRFIFCTVAVYGMEYTANYLQLSAEIFEEALPKMLYASELECIQQQHLKSMLTSKNLEIVSKVLCQENSSKAILCCTRLCSEFKLWQSDIWNILLEKMAAMSLIEPLYDTLKRNSEHLVHMWHFKSFVSAWNCVIYYCFKEDYIDPSELIRRLLEIILECPCAESLDVVSIWNDFKYFVKNSTGDTLEDKEPVSDVITLIKVLQLLQTSY